jgi:hypothetical protein
MVEPLREFYVTVPGLREVGGRPVKTRGNDRIVLLTAAQATYWLDQGAISTSPGERPVGSALGRTAREPAPAHARHAAPHSRRKKEAAPE